MTSGNLSTDLHDIHPSGLKALFSTSKMDYSEVPFTKQNLYEIDLTTNGITSIWTDKKYDGRAKYSPDGSKLLVLGGPECFGDLGKKVSEGKIANNFDQQIYLYDLKTKKVEPLSLNFDPAINNAHWTNSDELLLDVSEKTTKTSTSTLLKQKKFKKSKLKQKFWVELIMPTTNQLQCIQEQVFPHLTNYILLI
ncbi:MAG: hypothetical protein HC831_09355 [Chloroflexia bacterium]|nr:hypothetical protein [Chloroflexia bacterium]